MRGNRKNLAGMTFGKWLVVGYAETRGKRAYWNCRCECGAERQVSSTGLLSRDSTSCGCYQKQAASRSARVVNRKHGMFGTSEYSNWANMLQRCLNPKAKDYPHYGGRGITVCERWRTFENFYADMGPRPSGLSIDRRDNNGNYEPGNCRWATDEEQQNNKRTSRKYDFNGSQLTIRQISRLTGVNKQTIKTRLRKGVPIDRAVMEVAR